MKSRTKNLRRFKSQEKNVWSKTFKIEAMSARQKKYRAHISHIVGPEHTKRETISVETRGKVYDPVRIEKFSRRKREGQVADIDL